MANYLETSGQVLAKTARQRGLFGILLRQMALSKNNSPKNPQTSHNPGEDQDVQGLPATQAGGIDQIDRRILAELQENARISNVDLAEKVGLSASPCLRRVRDLEEAGVIRRYATLVNPAALGLGVSVFVQVSLERQVEVGLDSFEELVLARPEVLECYLMTGDADYLLRVVVPDVAAFERFLLDHLTKIPGVASIKSSFALKQVTYRTALPIPGLESQPTRNKAAANKQRRAAKR